MIQGEISGSIVDEFQGARLKDKRLSTRLISLVQLLDKNPADTFPTLCKTEAELEAFYRFIGNSRFCAEDLLEPHQKASRQRAAALSCALAIHDSTCIDYSGESPRRGLGYSTVPSRLGYVAHVSLLVDDKSNLPLGVANVETITRTPGKNPGKLRKSAKDKEERDSYRWIKGVSAVEDGKSKHCEIIHIMDAEADFFELLAHLHKSQASFVIRAGQLDRIVNSIADNGRNKLRELLATLKPEQERVIELQARNPKKHSKTKSALKKHPPRESRMATVAMGSSTIRMNKSSYSDIEASFEVNVVRVWEPNPGEEESPIEWVIFTNQPIDTNEQVSRVVDLYRRRWLIEDFFKSLKTGCSIEKRQIESYEGLLRVLMLLIPIAYRLLFMRALERLTPEAPATEAFSPIEIAVLTRTAARTPKNPNPAPPTTVKDALALVARLGGHIKNNGAPGWLVLGRGFHELLTLVRGATLFTIPQDFC